MTSMVGPPGESTSMPGFMHSVCSTASAWRRSARSNDSTTRSRRCGWGLSSPSARSVPPARRLTTATRQALSPDGLRAFRPRIGDTAILAVHPEGGNSGDTTFVCAADAEGNAASLMSSICGIFGSGLLAGETGIILNSRASGFSTRPGHPNALAPGARPRHTILPGMVLREGHPECILGCIGANNRPQGQVQTLVNALDLGMNPQQAVDSPRFRAVMTTGEVQLDPEIADQVGNDLLSRGHHAGDACGFKGAAQMVRIHREDEPAGAVGIVR